MRYLVCFDLVGKDRDYDRERLTNRIKQHFSGKRTLYSQWVVVSNKTPEEVANELGEVSPQDIKKGKLPPIHAKTDRLAVVRIPDKVGKRDLFQRNLFNRIKLQQQV